MLASELGIQSGPTAADAAVLFAKAMLSRDLGMHTWKLPGGVYPLDNTLVTNGTGRRLEGQCVAKLDITDNPDNFNFSTRLVMRQPTVTFDGRSVAATSPGNSTVLQVSGFPVRVEDRFNHLEMNDTGGFDKGIYQILAADPVKNTLTLDRPCSAGPAKGMTGRIRRTIHRDESLGTGIDGWSYRGSPLFGGARVPERAAVGLHFRTSGKDTYNTGKNVVRNCGFANMDVAMLIGKSLARFGEAAERYDGDGDNHADHVSVYDSILQRCDVGLAVRSTQNLHLSMQNVFLQGVKTGIHVDRGGLAEFRDVWFTGSDGDDTPLAMRIGGQGGKCTVHGPISWTGGSFDAPSPGARLLHCDGVGDAALQVKFSDFRIRAWNEEMSGLYFKNQFIVLKDGVHLTLEMIETLTAGMVSMLKTGANWQPALTVMGNKLIGTEGIWHDILNQPQLLLNLKACSAGTQARFIANTYAGYNNHFCREGLWECDGKGGGRWIYTTPSLDQVVT